jgi:hypothetical protein
MNFQLSRRVVKIALILRVLAFQSLVTSCRSSMESDTHLSDTFFKNASDFNKILAMLSQDHHIQRIDFDFVTLDRVGERDKPSMSSPRSMFSGYNC